MPDSSSLADGRLIRRFKLASRLCAGVVVAGGALVLVGWAFDLPTIKSVHPSFVSMKANTAFAFVLVGVGFWLMSSERGRLVRLTVAATVCAIGFLTLQEYLLGVDLGLDELLFADLPDPVNTLAPGRMAPMSALGFLMLGFVLLQADVRRAAPLRQTLLSLTGGVALLAIAGYLFGAAALYGVVPYTAVALHTAVGLLFVTAAGFFARPTEGCMSIAVSDSDAATLARWLFPVVIAVPLVMGWLERVGREAGLYDGPYGLALIVLGTTAVVSSVLWAAISSLHGSETARRGVNESLAARELELATLAEALEQRVLVRTEELRTSERRFRALFDESPEPLGEWDFSEAVVFCRELRASLDGDVRERLRTDPEQLAQGPFRIKALALNHQFAELFGVADIAEFQREMPKIARVQPLKDLSALALGIFDERTGFFIDTVFHHPVHQPRYLRQRVTVLPGHEADWSRVIVSIQDMTSVEHAKLKLREDLGRRELLLREIHHRVKNNLAIVSSLFYLQSVASKDERIERAFSETQRRVRSMALVHETLYQSEDVSKIDFARYAEVLTTEIAAAYRPRGGRVTVRKEFEPLEMDLDLAVPCGLILNELVSNAFKHAFPGGRDGEIVIAVGRMEDGSGLIQVSDDGVGLPESLPTDSLGLRLVESLAQQARGMVRFARQDRGTEARLEFALVAGKPRQSTGDELVPAGVGMDQPAAFG